MATPEDEQKLRTLNAENDLLRTKILEKQKELAALFARRAAVKDEYGVLYERVGAEKKAAARAAAQKGK